MSRTSLRTRSVVALAAVGAVLLLGACAGPTKPGSAAVVGDERITDVQVAGTTQEVLDALRGKLPDGLTQADLNRRVITNRIQSELIQVAAEREGIVVTQGEIDRLRTQALEQLGSVEALNTEIATRFAIPPSGIDGFVRSQLQYTALVTKLGKGDQAAGAAAVSRELAAISQEVGTEVSPRFGTWVPKQFGVAPAPTDLAAPPSEPASPVLPTAVPSPSAS